MIRPLEDRFEGSYYDGSTAARHSAIVQLLADSFAVHIDGREPLAWPYATTKLAWDGTYGEPARLEPNSGSAESVVVHDSSFAESLRQHAPGLLERKWWDLRLEGWPAVLMSCVIVATLGSILYFWGVPTVADTVARFAPRKAEERLGQAAVNILAPVSTHCSDPAKEKLLSRVVDRLAAAAGGAYQYRVIYARLGMVNAFAAPGGYIVVSNSLLQVSETPEEFAGVLAHEMEHVVHKHSTRAIARELGGRAILSLLAVDSTGTPMAVEGASKLVNLGYQRADEEEADADGVALLIKARIRADGLAAFLRRMQGNSSDTISAARYLSTHPATAERVARLRALAAVQSSGAPLMTAEEWKLARNICTAP